MLKSILCAAVLLLNCAPVAAQSFGSHEGPPESRSVHSAMAWSTAASGAPLLAGAALWQTQEGAMQAVGIGIMAAGFVFGPSIGSAYLDDSGRAWTGIAIRGAGLAGFTTGILLGFGMNSLDETTVTAATGLILLSSMAIPYGLAYNFTTLSRSHGEMQLRVAAAVDQESGAVVPALVFRF